MHETHAKCDTSVIKVEVSVPYGRKIKRPGERRTPCSLVLLMKPTAAQGEPEGSRESS